MVIVPQQQRAAGAAVKEADDSVACAACAEERSARAGDQHLRGSSTQVTRSPRGPAWAQLMQASIRSTLEYRRVRASGAAGNPVGPNRRDSSSQRQVQKRVSQPPRGCSPGQRTASGCTAQLRRPLLKREGRSPRWAPWPLCTGAAPAKPVAGPRRGPCGRRRRCQAVSRTVAAGRERGPACGIHRSP